MTISAIIPVYGRLQYLIPALDSILSQTRIPDEIIIVDDHSLKPVAEWLVRTRPDFARRVRIIRTEKNSGIAAARNLGVRNATGDLVAFLDSDDIWEKDKTENQLSFMEDHSSMGGVYGPMLAFRPDGITRPWAHDRPFCVTAAAALIGHHIALQTLMIRRSVFGRIGGFDTRFTILDDQDFPIRLGEAGIRIIFLKEKVVTRYRLHDLNVSGKAFAYFKNECQIIKKHGALCERIYGSGSRRIHLGRAIQRYGTKVRFMGLPTRFVANILYASASESTMPTL